jgi:hypothetical protein
LGKIGGHKAQETLLNLLESLPTYASAIVKALHRSRYRCTPETEIKLERICNQTLANGIELLYMQKNLQTENAKFSVLINALNLELLEIRNIILSIFSCLYEHEKIFKIKQGLDMKKNESIANAMELIEITVKKELASKFNTLFESTEIEHRCYTLKEFLENKEMLTDVEILTRILEEHPILYSSWTKAYSLYTSQKNEIKINPELIHKFRNSKNQLLQETAEFVN